jgi:hypothetical protein
MEEPTRRRHRVVAMRSLCRLWTFSHLFNAPAIGESFVIASPIAIACS